MLILHHLSNRSCDLRQAGKDGGVLQPEFVIHRGRAADNRTRLNVTSNAALWGNDRSIAYLAVTHDADLSCEDYMVADLG